MQIVLKQNDVHFGLLAVILILIVLFAAFSFVLSCPGESFWYLERNSIVHNIKELCEKESISLKKIELQN